MISWLTEPAECAHCFRRTIVATCKHGTLLCWRCLIDDPCAVCGHDRRRGWQDEISLDDYVPPKGNV